jgi:DNA-binding transcriptional regulator YiaG
MIPAKTRAAALQRLLDEKQPLSAPERLLALRQALGVTQTELGEMLGASCPAVGSWEAGKVCPSEEHPLLLERWSETAARRLNVPAERALLRMQDWLSEEAKARVDAFGSQPPEVSP